MTCNDVLIRKLTNRPVRCTRDEGHPGAHKHVFKSERIALLWFRDDQDAEVRA